MAGRGLSFETLQSVRHAFPQNSNEITLYQDNLPVLKAERGVTLGLLKLIYSSDESNSGILLAVKSRLAASQVPCVVTLDNTSLNHSEYDLIVQAIPSAENFQSTSSSLPSLNQLEYSQEQLVSIRPSVVSSSGVSSSGDKFLGSPLGLSRRHQEKGGLFDGGSNLGSSLEDVQHEESVDDIPVAAVEKLPSVSTRKESLTDPPWPSSLDHGALSAMQARPTDVFSSLDHVESVPPDSCVQEPDEVNFVVSGCQSTAPIKKSEEQIPASSARKNGLEEIPEPDSNIPDDIQFNPEDFNFDINSVTPFKSDKGTRWPCDRCGKDFCSSSHLKRHWILHTSFKPYKCKVCNKCFPFHWDLKKHMTRHTGDKPFKCPSCTKTFNTQKELKYHNWLHTGKKEYECHVCHHQFTSPGNLKVHMRKHTGEKPYKCEYCPKSFHMQGHYQYHVRRHTGEKPYQCDICGKAFSYSTNLTEHRNVHTGDRPYGCCHCDKKFTHRSTLKQHKLMHEGNKPYKCHVCSKSFAQSSNYRMHLLTHKDKEDRAQECDLCGKKLLSSRGVRKHRLRCVKRTVERANANKPAPKKPRLKRGEYHCEHCPKIFAYNRRLEDHISRKHSPPSEKRAAEPTASSDNPTLPNFNGHLPTPCKSPRQLPRVCCPLCERQFTYAKRLKEHLERAHQKSGATENSSFAVVTPQCHGTLPVTSTTTLQAGTWAPEKDQTHGVTRSEESAEADTVSTQSANIVVYPTALAPSTTALSSFNRQSVGAPITGSPSVAILYVTSPSPLPRSIPMASLVPRASKYIPIIPKPASSDINPRPAYGINFLAGSPESSTRLLPGDAILTGTSLQPKPSSSNPQTSLNKILHLDGKDSRGAGETGSQALSALERLSAKVGMEEHGTNHLGKDLNQSLSALEQLSTNVGKANVA